MTDTLHPSSKRRRFSNAERLAIVRNVRRRVQAGESIRSACGALNIIPKQYREWSKTSSAIINHSSNAKSICKGPASILTLIEEDLLKFIFELREQGFAVSISAVVIQASRLMPEFQRKSTHARYQCVRRWIRKHSLVHRMGTHESQRSPSETAGMALDYVEIIRPRLGQSNRHQDFIINMDQTPIPFTFNAKKTLELVGQRTVHIRKSTNDTKRVTCAMTVSASGRVLTPLLVFKGAPNGRIERTEFATYPRGMVYTCQGNAWMDERVMHLWIDEVLKPYIAAAPPGIVPLLLLDSYRCHMMKSTVNAIEDLGVEVEHIPGGCTSLCQPVDVGVNKPFKSRMRKLWEEWMISTGLNQGKITPPTRKHIAEWCWTSSQDLPPSMVRNAWRHGAYSYYPPVQEEEEHAAVDNDDVEHDAVDNDNVDTDGSSSDDDETISGDNASIRRHDNPVQQRADGEDSSSSDDDEHDVRQSEPLFAYHDFLRDEQPQDTVVASSIGNHVDDAADNEDSSRGDAETTKNINDDADDDTTDDDDDMRQSEPLLPPAANDESQEDSLPPLPDTLELACILYQIQEQHANRSEREEENIQQQ